MEFIKINISIMIRLYDASPIKYLYISQQKYCSFISHWLSRFPEPVVCP